MANHATRLNAEYEAVLIAATADFNSAKRLIDPTWVDKTVDEFFDLEVMKVMDYHKQQQDQSELDAIAAKLRAANRAKRDQVKALLP